MEFYFGGPSSNEWNDSSKLESYIEKMENSFQSKNVLVPIALMAGLLLSCFLFSIL